MYSFNNETLSSRLETHLDSQGTSYIVSVSQSKRYLFSFMSDAAEEAVHVIDIQNERVIARLRVSTAEDDRRGLRKVSPIAITVPSCLLCSTMKACTRSSLGTRMALLSVGPSDY